MMDLHLVVCLVFAVLPFLTLINLKLTLREPKHSDLEHYERSDSSKESKYNDKSLNNDQATELRLKNTFFYLMKNFTILEMFIVRRARNKIPFLLSISIQAVLSIMLSFSFIYSSVGIVVTAILVLIKGLSDKPQDKCGNQNNNKRDKKQIYDGRNLQILLTVLSLLVNMAFIWIVYKKYTNVLLISNVITFSISFALDNFVAKPLFLAILTLPLSFSNRFNTFVDKEDQIVQILHGERVLKSKIQSSNQQKNANKIFVSTSNTQNTIQIQPYVNLEADPRQNVLLTFSVSQTLQLHQMTPSKKKTSNFYDGQSSLMGISDSHSKNKHVITTQNKSRTFSVSQVVQKDSHLFSEMRKKQEEELRNTSFLRKKNKLYTDKMDFIKQEQEQQVCGSKKEQSYSYSKNKVENEQVQETYNKTAFQHSASKNKSLKGTPFKNSDKSIKNIQQENYWRNSYEKDQIHRSHQKSHNEEFVQNNSNFSQRSNIFASAGKNDLLKICEDMRGEDIGEIDISSPFKQRNISEANVRGQTIKNTQTKVYKKFSLHQNRNILPQLCTQQYMEMNKTSNLQLSRDKRRSSLQVSELNLLRKIDLLTGNNNDSRMTKSVKKARTRHDPIVRQNDQNRIPQFVIQDFNC